MHPSLLAVLAATLSLTVSSPRAQEAPEPDLTSLYQGFAADADFDGLVELWKHHEDRVLGTIDRDLEGSLSLWESVQGDSPEELPLPADAQSAIDALHARALFGARAASAAFDRPIFLDYAASFVGWTTAEKRAFRAGQQAFGASIAATRTGDTAAALTEAQRCTNLALPLGDWWGAAMGLGASGRALMAQDKLEPALANHAQARLLNHDLGLAQAEARNLTDMLTCLEKLERWPRALAVCDALMAKLGDAAEDLFGDRRAAIAKHLAQ